MALSLVNLVLSSMPAVPVPNKWTKLYDIVELLGIGYLINNFLGAIFVLAFSPLQFKEYNTSSMDVDPGIVQGLNFHEVNGKRFKATRDVLQSNEYKLIILILMVASEFLRWLRCQIWIFTK